MNRFRTGRGAPPWAWMQTGPLTVDVEACMSNKDRGEVTYVSPTNVRHEYVPPAAPAAETTLACTEAVVEAERVAAATPEVSAAALPSEETQPATEDTKLTLDDFPALKAAMESFEKRGEPILIPACTETALEIERAGSQTSATEPVYTEGALSERAPNRRRAKAKPAKRRSKRIVKGVNLRPHAPKRKRIPATEAVSAERPGRPRLPKTQAEIDLSHHKRRCTICHHPERESIEEAFCQWRNVRFIDREFNPGGGPTAIYRHARALNLFKQRNLTLRSSLEFVIEQSERIIPTAAGLVKAIRAYTRINDVGEWIDTPTTHIVQVMAIASTDAPNLNNSAPGLTLNVRKHPGDIIESAAPQQLLTGSAPQTEIAVTD